MKLSNNDKTTIMQAIQQAEKRTSGEIRVHVTYDGQEDQPLESARLIFLKLGMQATRDRNGVLIYFNPKARKFALYGDSGIHEKLGQHYWDQLVSHVRDTIREKDLLAGILDAVHALGEQLSTHFPGSGHNPDELTNEISETH
jgi:uncharacterized membrane protein